MKGGMLIGFNDKEGIGSLLLRKFDCANETSTEMWLLISYQ